MALNVQVIISALDRFSAPIRGMTVPLAQLEKDLEKGSQASHKFAADWGNVAHLSQTAGLALAGVGAGIAGSLALAAKSIGEYGHELELASAKTGVSVTALSELKYAAELSGSSLQQLTMGLRFLEKNAAAPTKQAAAGFEALGIKVREANGHLKGGEALLMETADRLRHVSDASERTALAVALFGRGGLQMLPMIMAANGGLAGLRAEAVRLGISLSEADVKGASAFREGMERLHAVTTVAFQRIGLIALPVLRAVTDRLADAVGWMARFTQAHPLLARMAVVVAVMFALLASTLGGILLLIAPAVNGWRTISMALASTSGQAALARIGLIGAGLEAKLSGISAAAAAGDFGALAAAIWAVLWPILAVVGAILVLVGAINNLLHIGERWAKLFADIKSGNWEAGLKDAALHAIPEVEGFKVIKGWINELKGTGAGPTIGVAPSDEDISLGGTMDEEKAAAKAERQATKAEKKGTAEAQKELAKAQADASQQYQEAMKAASVGTAEYGTTIADSGAQVSTALVSASDKVKTAITGPTGVVAGLAQVGKAVDAIAVSWQKRTDRAGVEHWDRVASTAPMTKVPEAGSFGAALIGAIHDAATPDRAVQAITTRPGFGKTSRVGEDTPEEALQRAWNRYNQAGAPPIFPLANGQYLTSQGHQTLTTEQATEALTPPELHVHTTVELDGRVVARNEHVQTAIANGAGRVLGDVAKQGQYGYAARD